MTTPCTAGWYNDPDGSDAERYFDGEGWTPQRRRKPTMPRRATGVVASAPRAHPEPATPSAPPPAANSHSSPPDHGHQWGDARQWDLISQQPTHFPSYPMTAPQSQNPFLQPIRDLSMGTKIGLSVVTGVLLLIIAVAVVSAEPWHSQRYKECKAAAEHEGYRGAEREAVIKFCVDMQ